MGVTNLVIVSDLHVGCQLGLCPPRGVKLDEGGRYTPNAIQRGMWKFWTKFWGEWVPKACHDEPYAVLLNGDCLDGNHHQATHQWSHNPTDQAKAARSILEPIIDGCDGRYYHVRGTEAHSGKSGTEEESLAQSLGAIPNDFGQFARNELWVRVGGALVHAMHHIGTTSSSAHEASAVNAELTAEYVEAARWGEQPPHYVIRSHRHRFISVNIQTNQGYAAGSVTPGWQAKTPFAYKIAGARLAPPQWGGLLIRQGDQEHYMRYEVYAPSRPKEELL